MTFQQRIWLWCIALIASLISTAVSIHSFDVPLAQHFWSGASRVSGLGKGLGSTVLVSGEMTVVAVLAAIRLSKGSLPSFAKAVFVACCASLAAFVANDYVLKFIFGRQNPSDHFQRPTPHTFHFFLGSPQSSFPSGHMVMAAAFAVVMIRLEPRTLPYLSILLCIGAALLLIGDWHFLGDIIAGTFVGGTAGLVAAELWTEHTEGHISS